MLDIFVQAFQNPTSLVVLLVEFVLGFGLGYVSVKAFKYVVAFIAILVVGVMLNVYSLGLSLEGLTGEFGQYALKAKDLIFGLAGVLGLLTLGPATIGFAVGALTAWIRR